MAIDVLTEKVRKDVPESMMFADDVVLYGGNEVDMTEYLESGRKTLKEREMRVSRLKQSGWNVGSNKRMVDRQTVKISGK